MPPQRGDPASPASGEEQARETAPSPATTSDQSLSAVFEPRIRANPFRPPVSGDRVGAYRLVEEIGRGGMGVVFLAERDDGRFRKRVAIKILPVQPNLPRRLGVRFQTEREILAQLEHPAIARLLDGGETEGGAPYLVMEYVQGETIDAYCDRERLSVEERIALFFIVGEAVAYAHQNLVVHRDIKPSNVLVSAAGEVKLLDFGIAKVLSHGPEAPVRTATFERAMTPAYASPEQVRGDPIRIVSDVYSLGVLFYELLTGTRPYQTGPLAHEVTAAILDQEPIRPSAAVLSPLASQARATTPERLRSRLAGDLDAIVLKALRKEPGRRYHSVEEMLDDLRRHVAGAPVGARGDDRWYRVSKFVRQRWPVVGAAVLLLVVGAGLTAFHTRRMQAERDVARREAATAQAVTGFVMRLFEASNAWGDSPQAFPDKVTARDLLDRGTKRIRNELSDQPEVRAELLSRLGSIYSSLGLHDQAETLLTEALGLRRRLHGMDSAGADDDLDRLSWVYFRKGDYLRAEACDREAYEIRSRRFGPDSAEAAASLHKIGLNLRKLGKITESELAFRTALTNLRRIYGDQNKDVALAMKGLAMIRRDRGDLVEAESLARQALEVSRKLFGDRHSLTTEHRSDLATILRTKGDLVEAERLFRQALDDNRAWFGDEHPNVALRWNGLGVTLRQKKDLDGAERAFREALRLNRMFLGHDHPNIAGNLDNLGVVLRSKGDLLGAEASFEEALAMRRKVLPKDHPDIATTMTNLAQVMQDKGNPARAADLYQAALDSLRRSGADQTRIAAVEDSLRRASGGPTRTEGAQTVSVRQGP